MWFELGNEMTVIHCSHSSGILGKLSPGVDLAGWLEDPISFRESLSNWLGIFEEDGTTVRTNELPLELGRVMMRPDTRRLYLDFSANAQISTWEPSDDNEDLACHLILKDLRHEIPVEQQREQTQHHSSNDHRCWL